MDKHDNYNFTVHVIKRRYIHYKGKQKQLTLE